MQANKLWIGADYAFGWRGRGAPLPVDAERVKVLKIIKEPIFGKTKSRTFAMVLRLNDDGTPNPKYATHNENGGYKVPVREILEFWDEYIETVQDAREEQKRQHEEYLKRREEERIQAAERNAAYYVGSFLRGSWLKEVKKRREEQERIEREALEKRTTRLNNVLIARGFYRDEFWMINQQVVIKMDAMERWLGFDK